MRREIKLSKLFGRFFHSKDMAEGYRVALAVEDEKEMKEMISL